MVARRPPRPRASALRRRPRGSGLPRAAASPSLSSGSLATSSVGAMSSFSRDTCQPLGNLTVTPRIVCGASSLIDSAPLRHPLTTAASPTMQPSSTHIVICITIQRRRE